MKLAQRSRALSSDSALIAVRIAVLATLYLFLVCVVWVVWRDVSAAVPARRGTMGRAFLVVVEGTRQQFKPGDRIPLEGAASIGRDSDNQVVVDESTVS